jgi:Maltose acetyltransferase
MPTERERMLAGELYDALDPDLVASRDRARDLCQALNATRESEQEVRRDLLKQLFGKGGDTVWMQPPFYCDYGWNIELGERVFFNFNCIVLDVCRVRIGDYTLFGPGVQILNPGTSVTSGTTTQTGVWETDRYRLRCLGGWRSTHSSRRSVSAQRRLLVPAVWSLEIYQTACPRPETLVESFVRLRRRIKETWELST